ncbi:MAG: hypothetical protein PUB23_06400 [Bacilli bacterium]|nr:hypothetical protein [Bacilli bacterium]
MLCSIITSAVLLSNMVGSSCEIGLCNDLNSSSVYSVSNTSNNDSENTAYCLSPSDFYSRNSYSSNVEGELLGELGNRDHDFYYLPILTKSNVSISLSVENDSVTEFYVYRYLSNGINDQGFVYLNESIINEQLICNVSKNYSLTLFPGTYYFEIVGSDANIESNCVYYDIGLSVSKITNNYSVDLNDLRFSKKVGGIVWENEYNPILNTGVEAFNQNIVYYSENNPSLSHPNYVLDILGDLSDGENIRLKTFYLFDSDLIEVLVNGINGVKNAVEELQKQYEIDELNVSVSKDALNKQFTVFLAIAGLPNVASKVVSFAGLAYSWFSEEVLNSLFQTTKRQYDLLEYTTMLSNMYAAWCNVAGYSPINGISGVQWRGIEYSTYYNVATNSVCPKISSINMSMNNVSLFDVYSNTTFSNSLSNTFYTRGDYYAMGDEKELVTAVTDKNIDILARFRDLDNEYMLSFECGNVPYLFEFTSIQSCYYYFYLTSKNINRDAVIDIFYQEPLGCSINNRIASYQGGFLDDKSEPNYGTYFKRYVEKGSKIYIRIISPLLYPNDRSGYIFKFFTSPLENKYHEHDYSIYVNYNGSMHKAICSSNDCNDFIYEYHAVKSGSRICMKCKAIVDKGLIQMSLRNKYITENGSYIDNNGVLHLVDEDIDKYYNNELNFYKEGALIL